MNNVPKVKLGIVAASRDCFPIELSRKRRRNVVKACRAKKIPIVECATIIENEKDALKALDELGKANVNALVIYLGNFGPEGPTTILGQKFDGPVMYAAAAEESGDNLIHGRGDAYCGLLNAAYNTGLRKLRPYIPEYPVGEPSEVADMIAGFIPAARIMLGLKKLKIFSFGPRPQDFLACNAPIKPSTTSASRSWRTASSTSTIFSSRPRAIRRSKPSPGIWPRSWPRAMLIPTF